MTRVAAAVTLVVALSVVALGERGSGVGSAQAAVKRAATKAADARSSRFTMRWTAPKLPELAGQGVLIEGLMDYVHHRGRLSYWPDNEILYNGDVVYLRWPLPWRKEAPWLRYEVGGVDIEPLDLRERAMRNPVGLLAFLTGASTDTTDVGAEYVRDTPTTHYEGTLDLQLVVDQAPASKREELQHWLDVIAEHEPTKVPFGLWVDDKGVTHRLRIDGRGVSVTIEYFDLGVPVEITLPPASELINFEELSNEISRHSAAGQCTETAVDETGSSSADRGPKPDEQIDQSRGTVEENSPMGTGTGGTVQLCIASSDDSG